VCRAAQAPAGLPLDEFFIVARGTTRIFTRCKDDRGRDFTRDLDVDRYDPDLNADRRTSLRALEVRVKGGSPALSSPTRSSDGASIAFLGDLRE